MRELLRVSGVQRGECRIIRRGKFEVSQGVRVDVSSWRERGGQRWLCLVIGAHTDPHTGEDHGELEVFVPVDVFNQSGPEAPGPMRAYVTR